MIMPDPYATMKPKADFQIHFCNGIHVVLPASPEHDVVLYDETGRIRGAIQGAAGHVSFPFRWLEKWRIVIEQSGIVVHEHVFNPSGKRVLISLGSRSMGDTIAWTPYLERFRERWGCHVIGSTLHNDWIADAYPSVDWIPPGTVVHNLYAIAMVGWYYHATRTTEPNPFRAPRDFRTEPMQWTAARALGLPPSQIRPKVSIVTRERPIPEPYVCLGIHSTAQAKYWNRPGGWDEVAGWLRSRGYRVFIASQEPDGHMGNCHPAGAERLPDYEIEDTATWIKHASAFVGVGSGLTWLAWALGAPVVLISGFSESWTEMTGSGVYRIGAPAGVCRGCFHRHRLAADNWQWCPDRQESNRFECSRAISAAAVIDAAGAALGLTNRPDRLDGLDAAIESKDSVS